MAETLTYKKDVLVKALQDSLAAKEKARKDQQDALAAKHKEPRDRLVAALDKYPRLMEDLIALLQTHWVNSPSSPDFEQKIAASYTDRSGYTHWNDPDKNHKQLITMYEKAEGDTITVEQTANVLNYL